MGKGTQVSFVRSMQAVGRMKDWIWIVLIERKTRRAVQSIPRSVHVMYHLVGFILTKGVLMQFAGSWPGVIVLRFCRDIAGPAY